MKNKLLVLLLVVCVAVGMLPVSALAQENEADTWDGTADTNWYDASKTEFEIKTAEDLAGLSVLVNEGEDFSGKTIALTSDVDLSGHPWVSIGSGNNAAHYFGGTFDGQNHCIYNITSVGSLEYCGLFGCVSSGGTIKNLGVVDANFINPAYISMGILVGWANDAEILNCYTTGSIQSSHEEGGFHLIGGFIGQCTAGTRIIGCYSTATVESLDKGDDCDTVGGLVGQWENATDDSLISDCWFGGKIVCEYPTSAVGGILGANFDFYDDQPGVTIRNCLISSKDITCIEPGNFTWIAAVVNGPVTNCYWPTDDSEAGRQYAAVVKLIVDWDAGEANADPNFDQSICGEAAADFASEDILDSLNENAAEGVHWTVGINGPTFGWDDPHIPADYSAVDAARTKVPADLSVYTDETVSVLTAALAGIQEGKSKSEQAEVDAVAAAIEDAIAALIYKDADYSAVDAAIAKADALNKDEYKDFSAVDAAVKAVVREKNITAQEEVDAMAKAINDAISALEKTADTGNPATGDNSHTYLWFFLLISSAGVVCCRKKKQTEKTL